MANYLSEIKYIAVWTRLSVRHSDIFLNISAKPHFVIKVHCVLWFQYLDLIRSKTVVNTIFFSISTAYQLIVLAAGFIKHLHQEVESKPSEDPLHDFSSDIATNVGPLLETS
jgi:hypothetical protein